VEFAGTITLTRPEVRQAKSLSAIWMLFSQRMATGAGSCASSRANSPRASNSTREAARRQLTLRRPVVRGSLNRTFEPYVSAR